MPNILDLIASDAGSSDISDAIKDALYAKSSEKLDALKKDVATQVFDEPIEDEHETEAQAEVEDETTVEPQEEE
tara:strand:+ start:380 stop:601 length:222 start_codon:yes stop_codon:yes gene_type:complete